MTAPRLVGRGGQVELRLGAEEREAVAGAGEQAGGEQDEQRAGGEGQHERDQADREQDEADRLHAGVRGVAAGRDLGDARGREHEPR